MFQRPSKVHKDQYTQNTLFLYLSIFFLFFLLFFFFFIIIKNNLKQNKDKQENKKIIKTRLTQNTTRTMQEIRKDKEPLGIFFLSDGRPRWGSFLLHEPLFKWIRRRVETIEVREKYVYLKKFFNRG